MTGMRWDGFHHPDYCATVIRRRFADELLWMVDGMAGLLATRGRSALWHRPDSDDWAYESAMYRLKRAGLVAFRRTSGQPPVLHLLPAAEGRMPDELRPERMWRQKWNGIWYVLAYDVPEPQRRYRTTLRRFLKRQRMGGLQGSVWISPRDIRPVYSDLCTAAAVDDYAILLESRTVLGKNAHDVVRMAWNMDRIVASQKWYRQAARDALRHAAGGLEPRALLELARGEVDAYLSVMEPDPLLPKALWPQEYRGEQTLEAHRDFQRRLAAIL